MTSTTAAPVGVAREPAAAPPPAVRRFGETARQALSTRVRHRRRVWRGDHRLHVEVRGMSGDRAAAVGGAVRRRLEARDDVAWARAIGPLGRAVVAGHDGAPAVDAVLAAVAAVEAAHGVADEPFSGPEHPGDEQRVHRQTVGLVADGLAVGLAAVGRLAQLTPLPVESLVAVNLLDSVPRVRAVVEHRLGEPAADLLLATVNATSTGLAQGTLGLAVDGVQRLGAIGELRAQARTWHRREPELCATPWTEDGVAAAAPPRPVALPTGPVERAGDRLPLAGAAVGGLVGGVTRNPRRGVQWVLAGIPKAATAGREAFASQLGRVLADRGVLVADPAALRRLDRVDTVVIDPAVLLTGRRDLGPVELVPAPAASDAREAHDAATARVRELYDPLDPMAHRRHGAWRLAPVDDLAVELPRGATTRIRRMRVGSTPVLGLTHDDVLVAVVALRAQVDPDVPSVMRAARHSGVRVLFGGRPDPALDGRAEADGLVAGGRRLARSVRSLQRDGRVVAVVAAEAPEALSAADVGLGLLRGSGPGCWSGDVICGPGLDDAALVLEAAAAARDVSRQASRIATAGSALGGALTFSGLPGAGGRRALLAVNGAALVSIAHGAWTGLDLGQRPIRPPVDTTPWHELSTDAVLQALDTSVDGLSARDAVDRHRHEPDGPAAPGLLGAMLDELRTPLTPILGVGAGLSAVLGSLTDAALVGGVLGVNAVVGAVQRVHTERQVAQLRDTAGTPVQVVRSGTRRRVPSTALVPGDVIALRVGDPVPADCRVLAARALEVDESALTGESLPVRKHTTPTAATDVADRHSMLYRDTTVAAGDAHAVVTATGSATESGRSAAAVTDAGRAGGVEDRIADLTRRTIRWSLGGGAIATAAGMLRGRGLGQTLGIGVNLAVAAVPEGLPILATAAQLAAARRLSARGTLVREPRTIETLGRVDLLAIDKTGTLTLGRIALRGVSVDDHVEPLDALSAAGRTAIGVALRASPGDDGAPAVHATDHAVVEAAAGVGIGVDHDRPGWRRVNELPFEPARGYHATLGRTGDDRGVLSVKGAPEVVLPRCDAVATGDGTVTMRPAVYEHWMRRIDELARRGHRVLAVAERPARSRQITDDDVSGLVLRGFLACADPVRPEAATAVDTVRRAGVDVVMITGDHPSTAEAVAVELGILNGGAVVTGTELDGLDDGALDAVLPRTTVFARVTPAHKVRVVAALQRAGRVVAMTGDGANDAPAIRLADVGLALGATGRTHAAREAADVVVTDARIETIIDGIVEGRATWRSVRDALAILVGGNLGEVAYTVAGSVLTRTPPINARQLLLVNLLTDMAPATAIAMRSPTGMSPEQLLREGPEASLGAALQRELTVRALASAGGATTAYVAARLTGRAARARTVGLVALVGSQLGQTVATGRSPAVVATGVVSAAALAGIVQTPGLSHFFGCTPLGPVGWAIATGASGTATGAALAAQHVLPAPAVTADRPRPDRWSTAGAETTGTEPTRREQPMSTNGAPEPRATADDSDTSTQAATTDERSTTGQRVGHAVSAVATETAIATVGIGAYTADLVRATPDAVRTVGDLTTRGLTVIGSQVGRGYRRLSWRGHRALGRAPQSQRTPREQAATAVADVARGAADTMIDAAAATEDAASEVADTVVDAAEATAEMADRVEPEDSDYEQMTLTDLRDRARERDITGRSTMDREQLITSLRAADAADAAGDADAG